MPENPELAELPAASPLRHLCDSAIDLARRLDGILRDLENRKGYADLRIEVRRGELAMLYVERSFKLN